MRRIRLGTLMSVIAILAMGLALVVYHQRATRRETQLLSALSLYRDRAQEAMTDELEQPIALTYSRGAPLEDVFKVIRARTRRPAFPNGFPIYVDPVGLQEAGVRMTSPVVTIPTTEPLPLGVHLRRILKPLGLGYTVSSGLLVITSEESVDEPVEGDLYLRYRDVLK